MKISGHYAGFPQKTLVVIMNHERARLFFAHEHDFIEQNSLHAPQQPSLDETSLRDFFSLVYQKMEHALKTQECAEFLVCIPEIHRLLFEEHVPTTLVKHVQRIVPKNLSAMQEGPIIRILFEG